MLFLGCTSFIFYLSLIFLYSCIPCCSNTVNSQFGTSKILLLMSVCPSNSECLFRPINNFCIYHYTSQSHFLTEHALTCLLTFFITPAALSVRTSPRQRQHLSLLDRLAMHATQNSAAGLALRLGQWVLSVVEVEQAQICPVKLKPDTALLRARISYSVMSGLWEALDQRAR